MLSWLIIGGGPHGTYLSHLLVHGAGLARDRVRVLDPHAAPLAVWNRVTHNLQMFFLRSTCNEHLDLDPASMLKFSRSRAGRGRSQFLSGRPCPSLALFEAHSANVLDRYGLTGLRLKGHATAISPQGNCVRVETADGTIDSRNVILATGGNENLCIPDWAVEARKRDAPVCHALSSDFRLEDLRSSRCVAIVGGGMTSAHLAIALASYRREVLIIARHHMRVHHFDADLDNFQSVAIGNGLSSRDVVKAKSNGTRNDGSITPELADELCALMRRKEVRWVIGAIAGVDRGDDARWTLTLDDGWRAPVSAIVLATGLNSDIVLPHWLRKSAGECGLPLDDRGSPVINDGLCWHPRIRVIGRPAEARLGPLARNLVGARRAGGRILMTING